MDGISLRSKMPAETTTTGVKTLEQHSLVRYSTGSEPTRRFIVWSQSDTGITNGKRCSTVLAEGVEVSFPGIGPISLILRD